MFITVLILVLHVPQITQCDHRERRSAFAPIFNGLYFDVKHRSGKMLDLAVENRRLLLNISSSVQATSQLGARLTQNVAAMAHMIKQLDTEQTATVVDVQALRRIASEYTNHAAQVDQYTSVSGQHFAEVGQRVSFVANHPCRSSTAKWS